MNTKSLISEFVGTFALIFIGAGALAIGSANLVGVALAHGLVIVVFIYAYGHISGTHINPAVTLGLLIAGEIEFAAAIGYWIVQFLGGILGAVLLNVLLPNPGDLGVTILSEGVTPVQGLVIEIVLTFFLVNTIFNTAVSGKAGNFAGLCNWAHIGLCHPNGRSFDTGFSSIRHGLWDLLSSVGIMRISGSISWDRSSGRSSLRFCISVFSNKKKKSSTLIIAGLTQF